MLLLAKDLGKIDEKSFIRLYDASLAISKMLSGFIKKLLTSYIWILYLLFIIYRLYKLYGLYKLYELYELYELYKLYELLTSSFGG